MAGILLNVSNLSRYQARGELQVELEGTGNLAGETYQVPNAYHVHMVAQRMDTTHRLDGGIVENLNGATLDGCLQLLFTESLVR